MSARPWLWLGLAVVCGAVRAAPIEVYAAGDIADCTSRPAARTAAAATARLIPAHALVIVAGDAVYGPPTAETYDRCYTPTWGSHLPRTLAVAGNHDYQDGHADAFFAYFGPAAGDGGRLLRRIGTWQIIGLDSELEGQELERQSDWLRSVLESGRDAACTLAFWHRPVFSSGAHNGSGQMMRTAWRLLDEFQADAVINGHEHFYEAFDPQDVDGHHTTTGLREFVVGTGGAELHGFWRPPYHSRARIERHGVLHLTLGDGSYAWEFIDVNGTVADRGQARCRRADTVR